MNEDDIYRTSTQYRHWSYTEESLASLRVTTNLLATTRVKDAIKRKQLESNGAIKAGDGGTKDIKLNDIDCLTVEEEQRLVDYYCTKAMELADFCEFPTNVKVCEACKPVQTDSMKLISYRLQRYSISGVSISRTLL